MWVTRRTIAFSVAPGPLVQGSPDRIAVYICNLGPSLCHLSTEPADVGGTAGLPIAVNERLPFYWEREGDLAQCNWYVTDPAPAQGFFILETVWYPMGSDENG